jgi:predicted metal-dependent hydrolase
MKKQITIRNHRVVYTVRKSVRARRMRIAVYCDGAIVVTAPSDLREGIAEKFMREKIDWISSKLAYFRQFKGRPMSRSNKKDYVQYRDQALRLVRERVATLNKDHSFKFNDINIKDQKTRWGSCSKKGNLNFNYKMLFLPEGAQDYIVAHELCHLKEFNHSKRFWKLVEGMIPDYQKTQSELRDLGLQLR